MTAASNSDSNSGHELRPRVVALLPTYNGAAFIQRMLDSLASQTYPNLDILISDDCSSDDTHEICSRFADEHQNVTLVRQDRNRGWVGNSNHLLEQAEGELLFFAFHDDELAPTYVEELVAALVEHPRAVLAYSDILLATESGISRNVTFEPPSAHGASTGYERACHLFDKTGTLWVVFRGVVRADAAHLQGGLRTHRYGERAADWLWLLGLSMRGEFVRVPRVLYTKHKRAEGAAAGWINNRRVRLVVLSKAIAEVWRSPISTWEKLKLSVRTGAKRVKRIV